VSPRVVRTRAPSGDPWTPEWDRRKWRARPRCLHIGSRSSERSLPWGCATAARAERPPAGSPAGPAQVEAGWLSECGESGPGAQMFRAQVFRSASPCLGGTPSQAQVFRSASPCLGGTPSPKPSVRQAGEPEPVAQDPLRCRGALRMVRALPEDPRSPQARSGWRPAKPADRPTDVCLAPGQWVQPRQGVMHTREVVQWPNGRHIVQRTP